MLPSQSPDSGLTRPQQVTRALWLVSVSVAFGLVSGAVSVITGLHGHSLGVFAVGLSVLADVTGSATLIWRFRAERHWPGQWLAYDGGPPSLSPSPGRRRRRPDCRVRERAGQRLAFRHFGHHLDRRGGSLAVLTPLA